MSAADRDATALSKSVNTSPSETPQLFATSCSLDSSGSTRPTRRSCSEAAATFAKEAPRANPITSTFCISRGSSGIGRHTRAVGGALFAAAAFAGGAHVGKRVARRALICVRGFPGDEADGALVGRCHAFASLDVDPGQETGS